MLRQYEELTTIRKCVVFDGVGDCRLGADVFELDDLNYIYE